MKDGVARKLGRATAHRWSMLRTMVSQLISHERLETTVAKAKELRKVADHMVTMGKDGSLAARRRAAAVVRGDEVLRKLFSELAGRYAGRVGGYTRVLQTRRRVGDGAQMAYIEFVDREGELRPAMPPSPASAVDASWARRRAAQWTRGGLISQAAAAAVAQRAAVEAAPVGDAAPAAAQSRPNE